MSEWRIVLMLFLLAGPVAAKSSTGTASIKLTGANVTTVEGRYPASLCGGPYMMGKGMAYQVQAGGYQITIASETRSSGTVPLNTAAGRANVVATVNGKGTNLVRGPKSTGSLTVSADYKTAEATLQLQPLLSKGTATLVATFTCK